MIRLEREHLTAIHRHAEEAYPEECCGLLVGTLSPAGDKQIHRVERATNLNRERARDRYELDPRDFLRVDGELRGTDLAIVGVYHSHPDHPARPSRFDAERAWPAFSYVIVSVQEGRAAATHSWLYDAARGEFDLEPVEVED